MSLPPLLECVPNVSEGRDLAKVEAFTRAIASVEGTHLLHRDIGYDANRTVFTFVGAPAAVRLSAKRLAEACVAHIDLRRYSGTHPFVGALDVCPFVALGGLAPKHATAAARDVAEYCHTALGVPVYLYEHSATRPAYRSLARVRRGGLADAAARTGAWAPDYGTGAHPTAGCSVVGARELLVAYNINLDGADPATARRIAGTLRSSARGTGLPKVRAIGWHQAALGRTQVSINLLDYRVTGLGDVYTRVQALAAENGAAAAGSELIGLAPLAALADVPRAFGERITNPHMAAERAAELLGLSALKPWEPEERILEYVVGALGI